MVLNKKENQYSNRVLEYEVLEREEVESIFKNIDSDKIIREAVEDAFSRGDWSGRVIVELDVESGNIYQSWLQQGNGLMQPDLYIRLFTIGTGNNHFDYCDEYVMDPDHYKEIEKLMDDEGEGLNYGEAYTEVVEKYDIDMTELALEYFIDAELNLNNFISAEEFSNELDRIYTNDEE